jgi:ketosteroid isomerase-like protein
MASAKFDHRTISDREEIRDVLVLYAKSLDRRDYSALRRVFTSDATGNYFAGGTHEGVDRISAFIERALAQCGPTQHLLGSIEVSVQGDTATANCYLQAIHVGKQAGYEGKVLTIWGIYRDRLIRTPDGWRIQYRELETTHADGDIGMKL